MTTNKPADLKACPFCGSRMLEMDRHDIPDWWFITCYECSCQGVLGENKEAAIAAWNTRPASRDDGDIDEYLRTASEHIHFLDDNFKGEGMSRKLLQESIEIIAALSSNEQGKADEKLLSLLKNFAFNWRQANLFKMNPPLERLQKLSAEIADYVENNLGIDEPAKPKAEDGELKQLMNEIDDFINGPSNTEHYSNIQVTDYRHELYPKWRRLVELIKALGGENE